MVPLRQLPLRLQRGRLLQFEFPGGHFHVMPARGWRGRPDKLFIYVAGILPLRPYSTATQAWLPWRSRISWVRSPMARAWAVQCNFWEGSQYEYGGMALWTRRIVRQFATFLRIPGNSPRISSAQMQATASFARCAPASSGGDVKRGRQGPLRKTVLQDQTMWWDESHKKGNSRWPHSWQDSGEALWFVNSCKPAWVDPELADLNPRLENVFASSASSWSSSCEQLDQLHGRRFGKRSTAISVKELCQRGQVKGAVQGLQVLFEMNSSVDKYLLYSVLKECMVKKDLTLGDQVHALAVKMGFGSDTFLCSHFIRMYAGHGKLQEAMHVFRRVALPDAFMWSSILSAHVKQGQPQRAIELYQHMRATMMKPDGYVFVAALQACAAAGDLQCGKQVHDDVLTSGMEQDIFVGSCLVDMLVKCGSLKDARRVFDRLSKKDVVTWTAMIAGYAQEEGMGHEALVLHSAMHSQSMAAPNAVTYVCLLQACANLGVSALEKGKQLHSELKQQRLESHVGSSLVNMYVKCGSLKNARIVFDGLCEKNVVTWTAMIAGYAQQEGMGHEALTLYSVIQNEGMLAPDAVTFVCLLQACANVGVLALEKGKQLHLQLQDRQLESDVVVGGSLVNMYVKCGCLKNARIVFDRLDEKSIVTWNAMISGYAQQEGMGQEALGLYSSMQNEVVAAPDAGTYVCLLQACANVGESAINNGKQLHLELKNRGFECDTVVASSLVNMYAKCGSLKDARIIFDGLGQKNVMTWNAMISGYAQQEGMGQEALDLFSSMQKEAMLSPDTVTTVCVLQACANVGVSALEKGKKLHSQVKERRLVDCDVVVGSSLVNMYAKCGSLQDARNVFDSLSEKNVVTWNAMIAGYAQKEGMGHKALSLYSAMHKEGMPIPNAGTYVCLLQACANVGVLALDYGRQLHAELKGRTLESDVVVGSSLVNMYAKCGSLKDARVVFDGLAQKNVVTWNALLCGYTQQEGMCQEALNLYTAMDKGMEAPDAVTYVCLLQACATVGALQQGKQLHSEVRERGLESNVLIGSCLVKMYAKCGRLEVAREVFDRLAVKNLVTWNALLKGHAEHGEAGMAIQCFEELLEQGVQPDEVTYICLFTACSHAGLVDKGQRYFQTMVEQQGVEPNDRLYCCMVDLFGRSGQLDVAEHMLQASGLADNAVCWTALLSACKSYGDAEIGRRCFDQLVKLEPTAATPYVLLGRIYANAGRWDEVDRVESLRLAAGAKKMPAKACIEVKRQVHEFTVGEERSDVAATLRKMNTVAKAGGHVPQTQLVLRPNVSEQEKEDALCGHAEKLALAYGLLHTPAGSALVVTKNLRMCSDCHSSTKIMSRLEKREIVVRDGHKVHRFRNGACSCRDRL